MNTFRNKWATSHTSFPLRTFKVQHKRNYSVNLPEIEANHTNAQTRLELIMITLDYIIHHNWPTVYSKTTRCVFCNTATGGQAPVVGFCNTPTGGLKVRLKRGLCQATQVSCLQELT